MFSRGTYVFIRNLGTYAGSAYFVVHVLMQKFYQLKNPSISPLFPGCWPFASFSRNSPFSPSSGYFPAICREQ